MILSCQRMREQRQSPPGKRAVFILKCVKSIIYVGSLLLNKIMLVGILKFSFQENTDRPSLEEKNNV